MICCPLIQYGGNTYPGGQYGQNYGQYPPSTPDSPYTPGTAGTYGSSDQPSYPDHPGPDAYRGPDGQTYVGGAGPQDGSFDGQGGPGTKTTTVNVVMNVSGPPPSGTNGGYPQVTIYS